MTGPVEADREGKAVGMVVPRPPRLPTLGEFPGVVEPALRDIPEFLPADLEEVGPVEVQDLASEEEEFAELARSARRVAFADERVRALLGERRHVVIGLSRRSVKRARAARVTLVAFCYDDALMHEVDLVDENGLRVADVTTFAAQPAPTDEEVESAVRIARAHPGLAGIIRDEFDAHVLLTSSVEEGDEHFGRRRFSVVFGYPDERLPRVHAVVDLASEEIVWARTGEETRDE